MIKEDAEKCCLNQFLKLYEHFMESDDAIKGDTEGCCSNQFSKIY